MDKEKLLTADWLDILFEGKNKEYGAYQLRKTYNHTLRLALLGTFSVVLLLIGGYAVSLSGSHKKATMTVEDVNLEALQEDKKPNPPVPPPPKPDPPKTEIIKFTPPKIVKDEEVKPDEKPPLQDSVEVTRIGTVNQLGVQDDGVQGPPVAEGNGVVEGPHKQGEEDYDGTFTKVEIESQYPGGSSAWLRYLNRNFHYPEDAMASEIQGMVVVQFIVDKEGGVSEVQAISGPEEGGLREEAVRVIKKSGKWIPAIQNGRQVKSYKKQPIVFKFQKE
jgi:protein TonB